MRLQLPRDVYDVLEYSLEMLGLLAMAILVMLLAFFGFFAWGIQ